MSQQTQRVKIRCNHALKCSSINPIDREFYYQMGTDSGMPYECDGCDELDDYVYYCDICYFAAHEKCIYLPDIINHPCHSRHPLNKVSPETISYTDGKCHFCRAELANWMYHCSTCNFSLDVLCSTSPPLRDISQPKSHKHTFTLLARKVSFTCNACGMVGDHNPYVCLKCDFMLHKDCIDLPRIININRHKHRVFHTYHLNHGNWECGVCREKMDWTFGAFFCKRCPDYAVHSKCATRDDVWDGIELEDKPEEDEQINHYSHEHNLRLGDDNDIDCDKMRCDACILPINSDSFFKCMQCEFFLHRYCASLPLTRQNIIHVHKLALLVDRAADKPFQCSYCYQFFDGFRYECDSRNICKSYGLTLDLRCGSISEPFHHELHPHPLYRISSEWKTCGACGKGSNYVLTCKLCTFALGMECATLPRKVKHRCDDHVLSLHHGAGYSQGTLWCDICERKTDPSVWFYGCDDCGVTLHIKCVLGDMYYLKPKKKYGKAELVANDGMTRPFCTRCKNRCIFPYFLKATSPDSTVIFVCSMNCAYASYSREWYYEV